MARSSLIPVVLFAVFALPSAPLPAGIAWPSDSNLDEELGEDESNEWIESGRVEQIPRLVQYLRDGEEVVQMLALAEFAGMGPKSKSAAPAVAELLNDQNGHLRVEAATTLMHMNVRTSDAYRALIQELRGGTNASRASAAWAIGRLIKPRHAISCWGPDPPPVVPRPWLGRRALPALVEALADSVADVRYAAAQTIGDIGCDAASVTTALRALLKDRHAEVRRAAERALDEIGSTKNSRQ